jgi:hypothetical protein
MGNAPPHLRGKSSHALISLDPPFQTEVARCAGDRHRASFGCGPNILENDGPPYVGEISEYDTIIL